VVADRTGFAAALSATLADPERRYRLAATGRAAVAANHSGVAAAQHRVAVCAEHFGLTV
jgi:hypothetical protein